MPFPHFISRLKGLGDSVNPYAAAPEGACSRADNAVCRYRGILESRPGFDVRALGNFNPTDAMGFVGTVVTWLNYPVSGGAIGQMFTWNTADSATFVSVFNDGNGWISGVPIDRPGSGRAHFVGASKAIYASLKCGLLKVEQADILFSSGLQPSAFSAAHPPNWTNQIGTGWGTTAAVSAGANTWLANNFSVAYRFTICRLGANKEVIESEPSERLILTNTSGLAKAVLITLMNSWLMRPDSFFRIYRTAQIAAGSETGDEMKLIAEVIPTAGNDAYGWLTKGVTTTYTDLTSDLQRGAPLYTNPLSGGGIAVANVTAPAAEDMVYFKNRLLLLNTTDVQRIILRLTGTGTGGIVDGDTITIANIVFTFRAAPSGSRDVTLATGGTVAANLENTARSLASIVNQYFGQTWGGPPFTAVLARYISLTANDAGQVLLQSIVPGADAFTVKTSSKAGWGTDYTTAVSSDPNLQIAGLSWSNQSQPEGVPLANAAIVGDAVSPGQRIIAMKEAALIFKRFDGLWRWTDDGVNVAIQIADPTIRLLAPETAQPLANFVFALCDQGVLVFSENGQSANVSHDDVGREILKLISYVGRATLAAVAYAVANESTHEYILCLPEAPNATSCTVQYVYNTHTEAWTKWTIGGIRSGGVSPADGKLYLGRDGKGGFLIERKNYDSTDYEDPSYAIACPVNTTTATMLFSGDKRSGAAAPTRDVVGTVQSFEVGDLIEQAQATYYVRQRVKTVTYNSTANQTTVTLDAVPTHPWSNGQNITVRKAIQSVLNFLPFHAGKPLTSKEWGDCLLLFRYCDLDWITGVEWGTEIQMGESALEQISGNDPKGSPAPLDLFAATPFDTTVFDRPAKNQIVKATLPQHTAMCALLSLKLTMGNALCRWELAGINLLIDQMAADVVR